MPVRDAQGPQGQRAAPAAGRATSPAARRFSTTSRRASASTAPAQFTRDAKALGITIHGTFIMGLPGETRGDDRGDDPLRAATSIPTRCRCRWPRRTRARRSTRRPRERGWLQDDDGLRGRRRRADERARLSAPGAHRRSSPRSISSIAASTSAPGRSSPSAARWCATARSCGAGSARASSSSASSPAVAAGSRPQ